MSNEIIEVQNKPLTVQEVKAQINTIQQVMKGVMKAEVHYGTVPGCGNKPTLLKPGAEKVMATFRLAADPIIDDLSTDDEMRYRVTVKLTAANGIFVGAGIGECSTGEEKYKWRKAVCGEEFDETPEDRRREKWVKGWNGKPASKLKQIRTQPADLANTILKMAKKRALVDAVLTATAASDIFDQDLEDLPEDLRQVNTTSNRPAPQKPQAKAQTQEETPEEFANGVVDGLGVAETEFLSVSQALQAEDGAKIHIKAKVKGIYPKKVGKNNSDLTSYLVAEDDVTAFIGKWGLPEAEKDQECFFIGCEVSTFKGKKQFMADQISL